MIMTIDKMGKGQGGETKEFTLNCEFSLFSRLF